MESEAIAGPKLPLGFQGDDSSLSWAKRGAELGGGVPLAGKRRLKLSNINAQPTSHLTRHERSTTQVQPKAGILLKCFSCMDGERN